MKRARDRDDYHSERPEKVRRLPGANNTFTTDRISKLSDELLVRILSFVSVSSLILCQSVSKKFGRLSVDTELWKALYYRRFVRPRAARIPGFKNANGTSNLPHHSSKQSRWLEDGHLVESGAQTNWKQQYRLRHNWTRGQCAVSEIVVAEQAPDHSLLVVMSRGTIYTADSTSGLRAWSTRSQRDPIASIHFSSSTDHTRLPTSITIDTCKDYISKERVVVGFDDGSFVIFEFKKEEKAFISLFEHAPSTNGLLSALAYASPYLLTMTEGRLLSTYVFSEKQEPQPVLEPPRLLRSLRSHTVGSPASLSVRIAVTSVTVAVAYALPTSLSGWSVGIQEMRLSREGILLESRLAMAADQQPLSQNKPTTMSYSHPYLLVTHPDNTLSSYLVQSTDSSLSISQGTRLWGHTSAVSGAHVSMRGKAVSVGRLGEELRVWDLEGGTASSFNRQRLRDGSLSVRVRPSKGSDSADDSVDDDTPPMSGLRFALEQRFDDSTVNKGWVGFDEQNVIVLREKGEGSQALVVYDFA